MISRACRGPRRRSPLWRFAVAAATFGDRRELGVVILRYVMPRAAHVAAGILLRGRAGFSIGDAAPAGEQYTTSRVQIAAGE